MNFRPISTVVCATTLAALAACSSTPMRDDRYGNAPPVYSQQSGYPQQGGYNQSPAYAGYGTVRSINLVRAETHSTTGGGAVLGAVLGAVVGNQVGGGTGRAAATVAGAVGGGLAGNEIEKRTRRDDEVFRVSVRFDDGSYRDFDFQRVDDLRVGDRVRWDGGQLQRM